MDNMTTLQGFLDALKRLVSSMKFWTFVLTLLTAFGAKRGWDIDPTTFWAIVSLGGVLLGVQGAADWGKNTAVVQAKASMAHTAKFGTGMHAAALMTTPLEAKLLVTSEGGSVKVHLSNGDDIEIGDLLEGAGYVKQAPSNIKPITSGMIVPPGDTRPSQGGFSTLGVMLAICALAAGVILLGCTLSCSGSFKNDVKEAGHDISVCAKAEADAVKKDISIVSVALEVVDIIGKLADDPKGEAENLITTGITKYGEPIVACAFNKFVDSHQPTVKTSQPEPRVLAAKHVIETKKWETYK